ncbi:MAG: hypothetical protein D6815_12880 [Candidatus Dadabacteria bacterium]|nr:MAG: hypothetical protein D6815_12880 [Candidatus Dadabacteria bacterium]
MRQSCAQALGQEALFRGLSTMKRLAAFGARGEVLAASGTAVAVGVILFFSLPVVGGHLIDQMYGYSYDRLMAVLADYGERGRRVHLLATATLDLAFPVAYVLFFAGLVERLSGRASSLILVPAVLGAVDLCENAHILAILALYPRVPRLLVASASCFTVLKHGLTLFVLLVVARLAWKRVRGFPAEPG